MNYAGLGTQVKQKYPQYADIPDEELGKSIVAKYPVYKDMIDKEDYKNPLSNENQSGVVKRIRKGAATVVDSVAQMIPGMNILPDIGEKLPKLSLPEHDNPVLNFILKDVPEELVNQTPSSLESFSKLKRTQRNLISGEGNIPIGTPQEAVGEVANTALLPLSFMGGGEAVTAGKSLLKAGGKALVKASAKKGLIEGAKYGAGFGALQGLHEGEDQSLPEELKTVLGGAVSGGVGGAVIGGVGAGGLALLKNKFMKGASQQAIVKAEKLYDDAQKAFVKKSGREMTEAESTTLAREIASEQFSNPDITLGKGGKPQMKSKSKSPFAESVAQPKTPVNQLLDDVEFEPVKEKNTGIFGNIYTSIIDRFHPITKLTGGKDIPIGENPKFLIKRYLGIQGIADSKINYKTSRLNPQTGEVEFTGEGLKPILNRFMEATQSPDERELTAYMLAQHYQELLNRGINPLDGKVVQVGKNTKKVTSNDVLRMSHEAMAELNAKYGGDLSQFETSSKEIRDWSVKAMLDPLLEVGRIDQDTYQKILNSNQFYVPLKRVMEELETKGYIPASTNIFVSKGNPLKTVRGSSKKIVNPLETLVSDTYRITDLVERDRVARAIVNLRNFGDDLKEVITETKPKMAPVAVETMKAEIDKPFFDALTTFAKKLGLTKFSTQGEAGKRLGYFQREGDKTQIVRKFGTSRETTAHEVGHFIDDKFGLYQKFLRNNKLTRKVGQEVYNHSVEAGESANRLNSGKERFANAFSWWMTHRAEAKQDMPKFSKAIEKIISETPELKPLLNIKPSPRPTLETMDKTIFRPNMFNPGENVITTFEDGKMKYWKVPEDVFKAVSGMNEEDMNIITKILAVPASMQRAGATLAPEFVIRNPVRDQFSAFVYSKFGYRPPIDFMRGLASVIKRDDAYNEWLGSGGAHSTMVSIDRESSAKTLDEIMKRAKFNWKNPKAYFDKALGTLQMLSETTEQATRVGMYKRARDKGVNTLEAVYESREGTLDFANRGAKTRAINAIVSFWNATVQGQVRMAKAFKERPIQTSVRAVGGITLPTMILYALNKDNPRYQELPQWQKDFFWIIDLGEGKPLIRIPKPFELGLIFGTAPEHFMDYLDKQDPKALTDLLKPVLDGATPGIIPTAFLPPLEATTNYNMFTGQPIDSQADSRLPAEMRGGENTSSWAKLLAKTVKEFTTFGVSPDKIEHVWNGYTATLGKSASSLIFDPLLTTTGAVGEQPVKPEMTPADIPVIKGFVAREPIGSGSKSVNDFYTKLETATQSKEGAKRLIKNGQQDEAIQYLKDNPEAYLASGVEGVADTLSDLRKTRNQVLVSKTLTAKQKREYLTAIDTKMTEIAKKSNEMYDRVIKELNARKEVNGK